MRRFHISSIFKGIEQKPPISQIKKPEDKKLEDKKPEDKKPRRYRGKKQEKPKPEEKPKAKQIPYKKQKIPVALREQVWIHCMGHSFEGKCPVTWCQNTITVFNFQSGHNIPESKGGKTDLDNLIPLCSRCNLSMGNDYTIDEWSKISSLPAVKRNIVEEIPPPKGWFCRC